MNQEDLRKKVDDIDARIAELIAERIKIAEKIGEGKKSRTSSLRTSKESSGFWKMREISPARATLVKKI